MKIVIATSRPKPYLSFPEELKKKLNVDCHFISNKDELNFEHLSKFKPRYVFLPHWSHKIPESVHQNFECVIFHMTDLPFGRGGSPLQNLIVRGFTETKISALRCTDEIDAGPIYLKKSLSLEGCAEEIYNRAASVILEMMVEIIQSNPEAVAQTGKMEIFKRRTPEESCLDSAQSLKQVYDHIRMLDAEGYPKSFLETDHFKLEFDHASFSNDEVSARVIFKVKNNG